MLLSPNIAIERFLVPGATATTGDRLLIRPGVTEDAITSS